MGLVHRVRATCACYSVDAVPLCHIRVVLLDADDNSSTTSAMYVRTYVHMRSLHTSYLRLGILLQPMGIPEWLAGCPGEPHEGTGAEIREGICMEALLASDRAIRGVFHTISADCGDARRRLPQVGMYAGLVINGPPG